MAFGVYIHFPFCVQVCPYCDFAVKKLPDTSTEKDPRPDYLNLVLMEIEKFSPSIPIKQLSSIYFGGGTPSLMGPDLILRVLEGLEKAGFSRLPDCEMTIEINPGTVSVSNLTAYVEMGINRFSVGVQTFDPEQLRKLGRLHTPNEAVETLELIKASGQTFNMDLMFALPDQEPQDLDKDLRQIEKIKPPHVSAYVLTLDDRHPLNRNRPSNEAQASMFLQVQRALGSMGLERYETSNYALLGFRSRHNQLYWGNYPYWGVGMSAHSYFPQMDRWGVRFSNPRGLNKYRDLVHAAPFEADLLKDRENLDLVERLRLHEALTDFCHTSLRRAEGLHFDASLARFGPVITELLRSRLDQLAKRKLLEVSSRTASVTEAGWLLNDRIFEHMTFLSTEIASD